MEVITNFISEHYPIIGLVLALLVIAVVATFKIAVYHASIQNTKQKVDDLPCDGHAKSLGEQDKTLARQEKAIDEHKVKINDISVWIMNKDKSMIPVFMNKQSPYYLNPAGIALLNASGGKECVDENIDFFITELEKLEPQTAYDVEAYSNRVLFDCSYSVIFKNIKDYVYVAPLMNVGGQKIEISLFNVISVTSLYLRDKYLELYPDLIPEINVEALSVSDIA